MKIEYRCANILSMFTKQQKNKIKILLNLIKKKGIKKLRVTNDSFMDFEKGFSGIVLVLPPNRETAAVYWRKDGILHREDGPAVEEFCFKSSSFFSLGHYYQDHYCSYFYSSTEMLRNEIEKMGLLILEDDRVSRNVVRLKVLSKTEVNEWYYWIPSHK